MRRKNLFLLIAALLAINLPAVHNLVEHRRLASAGIDVTAQVRQQRVAGGQDFLAFEVPKGAPRTGDPAFQDTARVDAATYARASATHTVVVRVLPGSTRVWRVDGQVTSRAGVVTTTIADVVLVVLVLLYLRFRRRLRPVLVLVAEQDLVPGTDEAMLDRLDGQRYLVCGVVDAVEDEAVVLDVDGRLVRVLLDGHANPVAPAEAASAVGTMVG